jgi:regulator of protease activity HflC (stomatin/prohibitin superfamily)
VPVNKSGNGMRSEAEAIKKVADAHKHEKLTVAKGEGEAIQTVYKAIHDGNPTNDLIAIKYLEALEKIADGKANKVFLPFETSGILGSIAGSENCSKRKPQ